MALIPVHFEYRVGLRQPFIAGARLSGSWNADGFISDDWTSAAMEAFSAEDGCPAFRATASLDESQIGREVRWGVEIDTSYGAGVWGIATEVSRADSTARYRSFSLQQPDQTERYHLTHCRRLGANKLLLGGQPAVRFAVWAPNARAVELVRGDTEGGYIWNDGRGVTAAIPMHRIENGIWETRVEDAAELSDFAGFDHTPYMFRITKEDGAVAYRTDLYSRCQIGTGRVNPETEAWSGRRQDVDGAKSCSVVVDPERVTRLFREDVWPETQWLTDEDFWRDEFDPNRPLPNRVEDLVIYELHVDGLGQGEAPAAPSWMPSICWTTWSISG